MLPKWTCGYWIVNNDNGTMVQKKGAKKGLPVSFLQQSSVIKFFLCIIARSARNLYTMRGRKGQCGTWKTVVSSVLSPKIPVKDKMLKMCIVRLGKVQLI